MSDPADGAGEWQEATSSRKPFKFQRATKSHEERLNIQNQRQPPSSQQQHPASSSTSNPKQTNSSNAAASSTLPTNSPQRYRTPSKRSSAAGALSPSVPSSTLHSRSSSAVIGATAGSDPKKWADIESRLLTLRDKQRQVSRLLSHRASHRDADDVPQQSSSNTSTLRASSPTQTALLTALEELKHGFVYPLQPSLISESTFYRTLELLLELLSNEYTSLRASHAHHQETNAAHPDAEDDVAARENGSCAFGCQEVEQFKVNISVFFQLLIACLSKRQLIYSNCPPAFFQSFFPLFFQLLAPANQQAPSWVVGWMRMDALRVLAQLLQAEQKEEQERRSNNEPSSAAASGEARKKATPAAPTTTPSAPQCILMQYHNQIISFLLPYVDLSQLPRLLALATTANSTSAVLDAVEAKQRLYVQLEYRRIAMQCVAHLSGRTSVGAASSTSSPLPNTAYIMLFTPLLQSFEFYLKESTHSIVWISLLSSSLKTLSFMLEDVTKGVFGISSPKRDANVVSVLNASQHSEVLNSLVQFISDLHKCIVWGTPLVLAPDHISQTHASPPPGLASSSSSAAAGAAAAASSMPATVGTNQAKEALTPRSVIGPPSSSPSSSPTVVGATFLSGAGSLFSPGSGFNILSGEHWRALQSRYALSDLAPMGSAENSGSESEGRNDGTVSGWTSANESDTDVYQSRVRGNKPTRPSAVNMALEAARAGLNITSLPNSVDAAKRMAHAVASEKVRANTFGCLLNFSRVAPKFFHQYWTPFIPTDAKSAVSPRPFAGPSLLTVILFDPSTRVRLLSAQVLANVLVDSPLTRWSGAMTDTGAGGAGGAGASSAATTTGAKVRKNREVKDKKKFGSAFTSLSVRFADTLRGLHIGLLESLKKESHATVLQQVLKTISVLVVNTPYQTVYSTTGMNASSSSDSNSNGLIVPIVEHLLTHMLHEASSYTTATIATAAASAAPTIVSKSRVGGRGGAAGSSLSTISSTSTVLHPAHSTSANATTKSDLRHAIFTCLATVFDTTSIIDEVRSFLSPPLGSDSAKSFHIEVIPLFLAHARARRATDPTPDAFTLLSKLARFYPATLARYWRWNAAAGMRLNSLSALLKDCLNLSASNTTVAPHDVQTQLLALKILEEWNKQDSGASSSPTGSDSTANTDEDDEEASGGNYEPLSNSEGFFSLEGALDMMTTQLLRVYHMHGAVVVGSAAASKSALTPAELHAQKQQSISSGNVRAKILACFSLLPFQQWKELSHEVRQQLIRLALDAAVDEVTAVRAASCRCLCLFALYSARAVSSSSSSAATTTPAEANAITPEAFLISTVQRLLTLINPGSSPVIAVRLKAVWALANMADYGDKDASTQNEANNNNVTSQLHTKPLHELLPSQLYEQVVEAVLTSTNDNEKILSNSVRALGNLARSFPLATSAPSSPSEHDLSSLFLRMLEVLSTRIQSSRSPKSRWNACHALGNAFHNTYLPRLFKQNASAGSIVDRALHLLVDVVADAPSSSEASASAAAPVKEGAKMSNFKVRINAASALAAPLTLQHYHTSFAFILQQLLHFTQNLLADQNSGASGPTFKDFKYMAQLKQQILTSLCIILCRYDGSQTGAAASNSNKEELFALYLSEYGALARLILGERLRWEKELRMLQRAERALLSGGASATSATSPKLVGAPSSSPLLSSSNNAATSAWSKSAVESAQALVEKAAQSVEGVLRVIEQSKPAEHTGLAKRFAAMANGELPESAMSPSSGIPKMSL